MTPVLIASLLDPILWFSIWFIVRCAYGLPKWSWIKLPLGVLWVGSFAVVIGLQAHLLKVLEQPGHDPRIIDKVLFPEIIIALALMFYSAVREDRAKKNGERH